MLTYVPCVLGAPFVITTLLNFDENHIDRDPSSGKILLALTEIAARILDFYLMKCSQEIRRSGHFISKL